MRPESIPQPDLDLLKTEIAVLASKISSVVDTLWKVRTASITLWLAVLSIGSGSFADPKEPILALLILSCLLPVLFINIDARNNRWYRRLSNREYAIQEYLNGPVNDSPLRFPIYDLAGDNTFRGSDYHAWEFSLLRSLVDPIPVTFYGGQLIFSAVACTVYVPAPWRFLFVPLVTVVMLVLLVGAVWAKRRALRKSPNGYGLTDRYSGRRQGGAAELGR